MMKKITLPLPIYESIRVGELSSRDGAHFDIYIGLTSEQASQLKRLSLDTSDTELQENTSDLKRFGEGSYEEWYGKDRTPYVLIERATNKLAALAWFGPKPLGRESLKHLSPEELKRENEKYSGQWHTIVYRSYPGFRGKGLMKDFTRIVMEDYMSYYPNAKLWAGIHGDNEASKGLVKKLGFVISTEYSDPAKKFWVMIRD